MNLELLKKRAFYRRELRSFFEQQGFLEVVTPLLVTNPGLEPDIQYFETEFKPLMGKGTARTYYLPTSPEYHLKALAWGADKIFEITRAFRNGEWGNEHSPESEMLEWYRQPGTYEEISKDVESLLSHLWKSQGKSEELKFKHYKVQELFAKHGVDLEKAQIEHVADFSNYFSEEFLRLIEPELARNSDSNEIVFLWNFPAPLRALSKLADNKNFCKRFEVYWGAVELGNAFDELIDPIELRRVCLQDQQRRMAKYGKSPDLDEDFIAAHHKLQRQIGGIAMGVDRIFLWLMGAKKLDDVMLFERKNPQ